MMQKLISLEVQIAEVKREINMRKQSYPRFVQAGRLAQSEADSQTDAMEAVLETLEEIRREHLPELNLVHNGNKK